MGQEDLRGVTRRDRGIPPEPEPTPAEDFTGMVTLLRNLSTEGVIVGDEARATAQEEIERLAANVRGAIKARKPGSGLLEAFDGAVTKGGPAIARQAFGAVIRTADSRTVQDFRRLIARARQVRWGNRAS